MLLLNVLLTDDVNTSATSTTTTITTSTSAPTPTPASSSTSITHISLNSLPPFNLHSNTFIDDVCNDSPGNNQIGECQIEMTNKSMTTMASATTFVKSTSIGGVKRFPVVDVADEAKRTLHFPSQMYTANSMNYPRNENYPPIRHHAAINFDDKKISSHLQIKCLPVARQSTFEHAKFPIFSDSLTNHRSKEFPVSKQHQNFRSSTAVKNENLGFEILPTLNDLNMPRRATETTMALAAMNATHTHTDEITKSSMKIVAHSTNLATTTASTCERKEHEEEYGEQRQRQEAQVHCEQFQYDDQERCASSNNDEAAADDGMVSTPKQPTGETITMDKNSNLETDNSSRDSDSNSDNLSSKQFMNVCAGGTITCDVCGQIATHIHDHVETGELLAKNEQIFSINGIVNSAMFNVPLNYDENDAYENFNKNEPKLSGGSQQPQPFAHRQNYSDVRDTSSKEVLADKTTASGQYGTCPKTKAAQLDKATAHHRRCQTSKTTFPLGLLTSPYIVDATPPPDTTTATVAAAAIASVYDKLPNIELLPNYYALELVESNEQNLTETKAQLDKWTVDLDDKSRNSKIKSIQPNESDNESKLDLNAIQEIQFFNFHQASSERKGNDGDKQQLRRAFSEMTLTKLVEHDNATKQFNSSSEPPSPVLSFSGEQLLPGGQSAPFNEMKFAMRATKSALPPSTLQERFKRERLNSNMPTTPTSSALLKLNQPKTNVNSLPAKSLTRNQPTTLAAAYTPRVNEKPRPVGNAATELRHSTRLQAQPESETTTRRANEINRKATVDAIGTALPTRTLLRRQRRMASQGSVDKDEDPIVRLNRLRARISGALSEVKGVLNKYSTEMEPPSEPTTTTTAAAEQPLISGALSEVKGVVSNYSTETESSSEPTTTPAAAVEQPLISGALSEVEGVLNKYSTATEPPSELTATAPNEPTTTTPPTEQLTKSEPEKPAEGPVHFRFVRKVRRRSVFADEDEVKENNQVNKNETEKEELQVSEERAKLVTEEIKKETLKENESSREEQMAAIEQPQEKSVKVSVEENLAQEKATVKELNKENEKNKEKQTTVDSLKTKEAEKLKSEKSDKKFVDPEANDKNKQVENLQIEKRIEKQSQTEKQQKLEEQEKQTLEIGKEHDKSRENLQTKAEQATKEKSKEVSVKDENHKSAPIVPIIEIDKPIEKIEGRESKHGLLLQHSTSRLKVEAKETHRRASTGAIKEATAADAALEEQNYKIKRRPSDSAAMVKDKKFQEVATDVKRKEFKLAKIATSDNQESLKKSVAAEKISESKAITTAPSNESKTSEVTKPADTPKDTAMKSKKRGAIKRGDSLRRASIAAVEKSKIEHAQREQTALEMKTQRRASVATAATIEAKPPPMTAKSKLITRRPTPRVKVGAKTKRSSLLINETAAPTATALTVLDESSTTPTSVKDEIAGAQESHNDTSIKAINDAQAITSSTTTLPSALLSSNSSTSILSPSSSSSLQLVNDSATTATTTSSIVVDTIKDSQKIAAKTNGQSVAIAIATAVPTSLVQSNKASSQIAQAIDTSSVSNLAPAKGTSVSTKCATDEFINQALATPEKSSATGLVNLPEATIDDIKPKPIHQRQEQIPAPSQLTHQQQQQPLTQQVAVNAVLGALDSVPEKIESKAFRAQQPASEVKSSSSSESATTPTAAAVGPQLASEEAATKAACLAVESNSGAQTSTTASARARASTEIVQQPNAAAVENKSDEKMPELQILPAPVKAVQIPADNRKFAPLNLPREELPKKKIIFKKIIRQKSTEKSETINKKSTATATEAVTKDTSESATLTKKSNEIDVKTDIFIDGEADGESHVADEAAESPVAEQPPEPTKKPRKIKKKVIIKRQQRRLSVSDQTFFSNEISNDQQNEHEKPLTETLEKTIAYVTDEEDEASNETVPELPLKGCMRQREFQVGDLVMYAERYKRTQVRWKKGRVVERISSISYKLDIDGKEVPAHISYIKRYTDRKVSFGGKEYLEIDYEQIAEEAEKARNYSIWNMV